MVKIKVSVSYRHGHIKAAVAWLGIPVFKRTLLIKRDSQKLLKIHIRDNKGKNYTFSIDDAIKLSKQQKDNKQQSAGTKAMRYLLTVILVNVKLDITLGTGDAMLTALACGLLQTVTGAVYALRGKRKIYLRMSISPVFSKPAFRMNADCIIKASPANIMIGYLIFKKQTRR